MLVFATVNHHTNGIDGSGTSAQSVGGTDTTWADDASDAIPVNPGHIIFLDASETGFTVNADVLRGRFNQPDITSGELVDALSFFSEGPIAYLFKKLPVTVGASATPAPVLLANRHHVALPGVISDSMVGVEREGNPGNFLAGSRLPAWVTHSLDSSKYDGARALLNLQNSGVGWNFRAGCLFKASPNLDLALSYKSASVLHGVGSTCNEPGTQPGAQWGLLESRSSAGAKSKFPQELSAGASWKFSPRWSGDAGVDWVGWSGAFDSLPGGLGGGNGDASWNDDLVYRLGLQYEMTEHLALRAGYAYGQSPVPDPALLPMATAMMEHAFSAGIGYHWRQLQVDLAYQYAFPVAQIAGASATGLGEFANGSKESGAHMIALIADLRF